MKTAFVFISIFEINTYIKLTENAKSLAIAWIFSANRKRIEFNTKIDTNPLYHKISPEKSI
jgi:hypothetical protein